MKTSTPCHLGCLMVLAITSCASQRIGSLSSTGRPLEAKDYPEILTTWTSEDKVYSGVENKVFATATFHSSEFRRAFAVAFPELYGRGGEITRTELVDLTGDVEQYYNFFLAVYTPDTKWNDFSNNDSIWRVTLIGSSEVAVDAHEIVPIKTDENLRAVYPYVTRFDKCYLVRFKLTDAMNRMVLDQATSSFSLRLASAIGIAEMKWKVLAANTSNVEQVPVIK